MKFLCGSCRTKYQISDEKVRGKILTIRCKKCGSKIVVRESLARDVGGGTAVAPVAEEEKESASVTRVKTSSKVARVGGSAALASAYDVAMGGESTEADDMPTSIAPVPANLDIAGVEWYVAIDGTQHGPFAFGELVRKLEEREVIARHYVWHDGMDNWKRVRDVPDLSQYVPATPKKKPPPPPPVSVETKAPRGADIVDIAAKRAERARQTGPRAIEDDVAGDDDRTAVETAGPLASAAQSASPTSSDRAEQLDVVLNEALGIEGEGQTTRAEPSGAVASRASVSESTPSIEDLLAFEAKEDDIFANLPRAADDVDVVRESTRFFVAAAGVNQKRKRNRMGLIVGLVAGALVASFIGAWAGGIIEIKIPGIGNPFASNRTEPTEELAVLPGDTDEDFEYLRNGKTKTKVRRKRRAPVRRRAAPGETGYVVDGPDSVAGGSRGDDGTETIKIDPLETRGPDGMIGVGDTKLPGSDLTNIPVPDRAGNLRAEDIEEVIRQQKTAVSLCFEQSLRAKEDLGGKIEFRVTVRPNGRVSRAAVSTTAFSGSTVANCIAKKIKNWRFPSFEGDDQQILVPFILQRQKY